MDSLIIRAKAIKYNRHAIIRELIADRASYKDIDLDQHKCIACGIPGRNKYSGSNQSAYPTLGLIDTHLCTRCCMDLNTNLLYCHVDMITEYRDIETLRDGVTYSIGLMWYLRAISKPWRPSSDCGYCSVCAGMACYVFIYGTTWIRSCSHCIKLISCTMKTFQRKIPLLMICLDPLIDCKYVIMTYLPYI